MGRRGPRPEPTAIKILKGNPGKRRLNDEEPLPPAGAIEPPAWLRKTGREIWDRLAPIAIDMQVLTTADALTFARYCDTFGEWLEAHEWIRDKARGQTTYTVKGEDGSIRFVYEFPQAITARKLNLALLKMEEQFGFTPAARSRIHIERAATQAAQKPSSADEERRAFFANHGTTAPTPKVAGA